MIAGTHMEGSCYDYLWEVGSGSPDNLETYVLWDELQKSIKLIGNEMLILMENWSDMGSLEDVFPVLYSVALIMTLMVAVSLNNMGD